MHRCGHHLRGRKGDGFGIHRYDLWDLPALDPWICNSKVTRHVGIVLVSALEVDPQTVDTAYKVFVLVYHNGEIFKQAEKGEHVWKSGEQRDKLTLHETL